MFRIIKSRVSVIASDSVKENINNAFYNFERIFNSRNHNKNRILNKKLNILSDYAGEMTFDIDKLVSVKIAYNRFDNSGFPEVIVKSNYPVYMESHGEKIKTSRVFYEGKYGEAARFANDLCQIIERTYKLANERIHMRSRYKG